MGLFDHFPYTNFHELNLTWILETIKQLEAEVDDLTTWMGTHKGEYQQALQRLAAVENDMDTFKQQINDEFDRLKADIEADFNEQKAELERVLQETKTEINREMQVLNDEVNAAIASFENRFIALQADILNEIETLKLEVRREVLNFYNVMEANNRYVFQWVENRIEEFINSLPEILTVYVYNPYRGQVTDIQSAINDLYEVASIWGLTAMQYDSLGLTASEYDALELTAREYDTLGYKKLYKDPAEYMLSPFTGQYVRIADVVTQLAQFHMDGLTATNYDAKDLDADTYDALDLTAFNYDWFANQLLA